MLAEYDRIIPGGAGRLVAMAESQMAHRQDLEKRVIKSNIWSSRIGQFFSFILGLTTILGGFRLIDHGKDAYGIAAIITAVAGLAGVFFYGRHKEEKERGQKVQALPRQLQ